MGQGGEVGQRVREGRGGAEGGVGEGQRGQRVVGRREGWGSWGREEGWGRGWRVWRRMGQGIAKGGEARWRGGAGGEVGRGWVEWRGGAEG